MIPKGEIVYNILRSVRKLHSTKYTEEVNKWLNLKYFEICKGHSWHALRRITQLDFTTLGDTDEDGLLLPANLFGIDRVRDDDNDIEFIRRDHADIVEPDEEGYRYMTHMTSDTSVFFGRDLFVEKGATTFTSASLGSTDYTGDYVKFHTEPGFYLLSAATTFTPRYWGPELSNSEVNIRPATTERMLIRDRAENILRDRTVDIYYWQAPQCLYNDSDMCILPITRPLELAVLIEVMGTIGKRQIATDRYRGEFNDALAEAKRLNPDFPRRSRPRDQHNRIFDVDQNMFAERGVRTQQDLRYIFRRDS